MQESLGLYTRGNPQGPAWSAVRAEVYRWQGQGQRQRTEERAIYRMIIWMIS